MKNHLKIENPNILIVGDSHTQRGINPKYFYSAINISQATEPYFLSFWKIKKYLEYNSVDTIILGCSHHNFSKFNDYKLVKESYKNEIFRRSYLIEEFNLNDSINLNEYELMQFKYRKMCLFPIKNHINYIGGFTNTDSSNLLNLDEIINRHYYNENELYGVSNISKDYLDSIINLTRERNITLIFITTPIHEKYLDKIPSVYKTEFNKIKKDLISNGFSFYDFSEINYQDKFYFDYDHLNNLGASKITKRINKKLQTNK